MPHGNSIAAHGFSSAMRCRSDRSIVGPQVDADALPALGSRPARLGADRDVAGDLAFDANAAAAPADALHQAKINARRDVLAGGERGPAERRALCLAGQEVR